MGADPDRPAPTAQPNPTRPDLTQVPRQHEREGFGLVKNYTVVPVDDKMATAMRTVFDRLLPGGEQPCAVCADRTAYHYAVCSRCRSSCPHYPVNGYIVIANGDRQAKQFCGRCGDNMGGLPRGSTIYDFCFTDRRDATPCERCGGTNGVELHHWAPRNTFGFDDAETWPQGMLCRNCHREWHQRMDGYRWQRRSA